VNAIKYLLIIFFILTGCQESNNKDLYDSSIEHKSSIKIVEQEPLSSYSKCLSMLKEYESILDELQSLSLAVDSKNLQALSDVTKISQKATQWVEKWKKEIENQNLSSDEIDQLIQVYEDLLKKYRL
tara:strand:+ start:1763 stop:2143 length:381 start_codon:yes stop_codon:yes gene_type:complete